MTQILNGTPISAVLTPGTDDQNTWPTHDAKFGKGGLQIVETEADRDNISDERKLDKLVYVKATSKFYSHNGTIWAETSVGNAGVSQSVLDSIAKNTSDIGRLKTHPTALPNEVYNYRGNTLPTLPSTAKKAYYISVYGLKSNSQTITLPATSMGVVNDSPFCFINEDSNNNVFIGIPTGETLDGSIGTTSINVPAGNMIFLSKVTGGWVKAFSGFIPDSLTGLISIIKSKVPGLSLSIASIEAALKDKLHTFREIQTEFQDQLHTIPDIIHQLDSAGYLSARAHYGFIASDYKPSDNSWIVSNITMLEPADINIPSGADPYLALLVPAILCSHISSVKIGADVHKLLVQGYAIGNESYGLIIIPTTITPGDSIKVEFQYYLNQATNDGIGVQGDDPTDLTLGITDLVMPSSIVEVDPMDNTTAVIKPYTNVRVPIPQVEGEAPQLPQEFKANDIMLLPPLRAFSDPNKDLGVDLEIDRLAYEKQHNPGFLAYLSNLEYIMGIYGATDKYHKGALWFDDVVIDADGIGIKKDRSNKAYGIQEYDGKDPNVTGGTDFMIAMRVSFEGIARSSGIIRIMLIKKTAVEGDTAENTYIKDKDGNFMIAQRYYKIGESFGDLEILGVVNTSGLEEFKCVVITDITGDEIYINSKEDGLSGLMIQSLNSVEKTGQALLQYEADTKQDINYTAAYLGESRCTLQYLNKKNVAAETILQGSVVQQLDGWGVVPISQLRWEVSNGHIKIDGDFNIHHIFTADETRALWGKDIKVTVELTNKQTGYILALVKHVGKPDVYTKDIFKSRNALAPIFDTGWALVTEKIINVDVVNDFHTVEENFTIPNDISNYAVILYPESDLGNAEILLKEFKVDVLNPFSGYFLHSTNPLSEGHLYLDKEYKHLQQDTHGYPGIRYTINQADTPLPVGKIDGGLADIILDPTINIITGSKANGGEGAIQFKKSGNATIATTLRVWSEQSSDYHVQFWYARVSSDGSTSTKIADSDVTAVIPKHTSSMLLKMPEFEIGVKPDDRIALFGKSDVDDGAFIECVNDSKPMVDTDIHFEEVIASSDVPDLGMDFSAFNKVFDYQQIVRYDFDNVVQLSIPLDIPVDVELAILSVHKKDADNKVRPIKDPDYLYDPVGKTLQFHFGAVALTGRIVLGFYV